MKRETAGELENFFSEMPRDGQDSVFGSPHDCGWI